MNIWDGIIRNISNVPISAPLLVTQDTWLFSHALEKKWEQIKNSLKK